MISAIAVVISVYYFYRHCSWRSAKKWK